MISLIIGSASALMQVSAGGIVSGTCKVVSDVITYECAGQGP
jgi:hypothetical protein